MAAIFEDDLPKQWNRDIKPDRKQVLAVYGATDNDVYAESWAVLTQTTTLGIIMDWQRSIAADLHQTRRKM